MTVDMDRVADVLQEAVATHILPRFRMLASGDISEKAPGEVVTIADRDAEDFIAARLEALLPGVPVVGEEAASENPALLDAISEEPHAWLVDPLDGTSNFAGGDPHWAVLVALLRHGEAVASWTYRPGADELYVAERGSGAWRDGQRLAVRAASAEATELRGAVLARFLTEDERHRMIPRFDRFAKVTPGFSCAGYEYPAIIDGEQDFALFQRLMPWDHATGALLLTEAGGVARHPDGRLFRPDHTRRGLLLASSQGAWETVRDTLYGT